jgi:hypothetical protein
MKNNLFKERNVGFWLLLFAAAAALIISVLYLALDGSDRTFSLPAFCLALGGVFSILLVLFVRKCSLTPFVTAALFAAASALVLRVALPSLSDVWNKVNFIGGNAFLGMGFFGLYLICAVLAVVSCYLGTEK